MKKLIPLLMFLSVSAFGQFTKPELYTNINTNIRLKTYSPTRMASLLDSLVETMNTGSTLTFSNGLTESGGAVKWGGDLTQSTTITGTNRLLSFNLDNNIYGTSTSFIANGRITYNSMFSTSDITWGGYSQASTDYPFFQIQSKKFTGGIYRYFKAIIGDQSGGSLPRFEIHTYDDASTNLDSSFPFIDQLFYVDISGNSFSKGYAEADNLILTNTSNQISLGTTRTVTITAPTPATASRTWTIPDLSGDDTFVGLTGSQALTNKSVNGVTLTTGGGTSNFLRADGSYAAPPSGFADPMTTRGDLIYRNAANATARLGIGGAGTFLSSDGTDVSWATPSMWNTSGTTLLTGSTLIDGSTNDLTFNNFPTLTLSANSEVSFNAPLFTFNNGVINLDPSTIAGAAINIPHGVAPTTPNDGDLWSTTGGFYGRVNGSTVGPFGAGGGALSALTAATGSNTINNAANAQEWQWNSLAGGTGLLLSSSSTAAASNTNTLFRANQTGANATSTQTTYSGYFSNTKTGTSSTNVALQVDASGGTNNFALRTNGDTRITGSGATSATNNLIVASLGGSPSITSRGDGELYLGLNNWLQVSNGQRYLYRGVNQLGIFTLCNDAVIGGKIDLYGSSHATRASQIDIVTPLFSMEGNSLVKGTDRYLNFNTTSGTTGYGFRDNAGTMEYKNSGGEWADFNFSVNNLSTTPLNETVVSGEKIILVDATTGNITINLPTAVGNKAKIHVKKTDSSSNTVVIDGNLAETIDGISAQTLYFQYQSITLVSNGTSWFII